MNINMVNDEKLEKTMLLYNKSKKKENLGSFLNILLNIFWIIFGGLSSAITCILSGIAYCVTIIGIPFGIINFKMLKLCFAPFRKRVIINFKSHWILNTLWLIFGGLAIALFYCLLTAILYITIFGIPLGNQMKKFALFFSSPFGSKITAYDEFSSKDAEKIIYTQQYIRRNNFAFDIEELNIPLYDKENLKYIKNVDYYKDNIFKYNFRLTYFCEYFIPIILLPIIFIFVACIYGIYIFTLGISEYSNLNDTIIAFIKMFLTLFSENDIYLKSMLIMFIPMFILSLLISIVKTIANPRVKEKYRNILCYGYGTRITLIKKFDNEISLNKRFKSLLYIYELNKNEIDSLIESERR